MEVILLRHYKMHPDGITNYRIFTLAQTLFNLCAVVICYAALGDFGKVEQLQGKDENKGVGIYEFYDSSLTCKLPPLYATIISSYGLHFEPKLVRPAEPRACRLCLKFALCPGVCLTAETNRRKA